MEPSKTLITSLVNNGLLLDSECEYGGHAKLENVIIANISNNIKELRNAIWFDMECIDEEKSYCYLFAELLEVAGSVEEFSEYQFSTNFEKQLTTYRVMKENELLIGAWHQTNDWVSEEFLDFCFETLKSPKGRFLELHTSDQSRLLAFVPNSLYKSYNAYRTRSNESRNAFFTSQGRPVSELFGDVSILESKLYARILTSFKNEFAINSITNEFCPDKECTFIDALWWTKSRDKDPRAFVESSGREHYVALRFGDNYSHLLPDEECYILLLANPDDEIIFSYASKEIYYLSTWMKTSIDPYLIVSKNNNWGVVINCSLDDYENKFIFIGDYVINHSNKFIKSIRED